MKTQHYYFYKIFGLHSNSYKCTTMSEYGTRKTGIGFRDGFNTKKQIKSSDFFEHQKHFLVPGLLL